MNVSWLEIVGLCFGSGGLFGIGVLIFRTGRIVEKIDNIEKRIEKLEGEIHPLTISITKIEVRLEERGPKSQQMQPKEISS